MMMQERMERTLGQKRSIKARFFWYELVFVPPTIGSCPKQKNRNGLVDKRRLGRVSSFLNQSLPKCIYSF